MGQFFTHEMKDEVIQELKFRVEALMKKVDQLEKGQQVKNYKESDATDYMKNQSLDISINLNMGSKNFTAYTMDLTKKYIEINADYRS